MRSFFEELGWSIVFSKKEATIFNVGEFGRRTKTAVNAHATRQKKKDAQVHSEVEYNKATDQK